MNTNTNDTRLWTETDRVRVKICGVRYPDTALELCDMGVDAIGLHLFGGKINRDTLEQFSEICQWMKLHASGRGDTPTTSVVLTDLTMPVHIASLLEITQADCVQLQGDITPAGIAQLRQRLPELRVIKTVAGTETESFSSIVGHYETLVDAFLLDKSTKGGTGETWDPVNAVAFSSLTSRPIMIAGGLNKDNIAAQLQGYRAYAVDVESGIEQKSGQDRITKKWTSIREVSHFLEAVKKAI